MVSRASAEGCHPLREVPSLRGRRSTSVFVRAGYFLLLQSGHGHWSQPQPVHASRIMARFYPAPAWDVAAGRQSRRKRTTENVFDRALPTSRLRVEIQQRTLLGRHADAHGETKQL